MITSNLPEVIGKLEAIANRDWNPFMAMVGQHEVSLAQERITSTKTDPDDNKWTGMSAIWASKRAKRGTLALGLLRDSEELLHSIHFEVGALGVDIGSDSEHSIMQYASVFKTEEGTLEDVPARPFLGWRPDAEAHYTPIAAQFLMTGVL